MRLSLITDASTPIPRDAPSPTEPAKAPAPQQTGAAPPPSPAPAARGTRMALIIGNGAYSHVKALPNPPNDACAIARALRDIGFTVSEGVDLDRAAMQKMTRDFLREAARAQVVLVYYAGHGVQVDGRNYLIPVDVELKPGARMTDAMIDMDTIMVGLDDQVRTNILIFDACRNNPMAQQVASAGTNRAIEAASGLAAPPSLGAGAMLGAGTLIAFATAPGQVALDGEGANSPFCCPLPPHRHARSRGAADADTCAGGGGFDHEEQAGAVVELVAAGRGLSGGEMMRIGIVPANCLYPGERSIREQAVPHIARLLRPKLRF